MPGHTTTKGTTETRTVNEDWNYQNSTEVFKNVRTRLYIYCARDRPSSSKPELKQTRFMLTKIRDISYFTNFTVN
jgi:hypothetical protein